MAIAAHSECRNEIIRFLSKVAKVIWMPFVWCFSVFRFVCVYLCAEHVLPLLLAVCEQECEYRRIAWLQTNSKAKFFSGTWTSELKLELLCAAHCTLHTPHCTISNIQCWTKEETKFKNANIFLLISHCKLFESERTKQPSLFICVWLSDGFQRNDYIPARLEFAFALNYFH